MDSTNQVTTWLFLGFGEGCWAYFSGLLGLFSSIYVILRYITKFYAILHYITLFYLKFYLNLRLT